MHLHCITSGCSLYDLHCKASVVEGVLLLAYNIRITSFLHGGMDDIVHCCGKVMENIPNKTIYAIKELGSLL